MREDGSTPTSGRAVAPLDTVGEHSTTGQGIRLTLPVTHDVLRESGQSIHSAVANALRGTLDSNGSSHCNRCGCAL